MSVGPSAINSRLTSSAAGTKQPVMAALDRKLSTVRASQSDAQHIAGRVDHRERPRPITGCPTDAQSVRRLSVDSPRDGCQPRQGLGAGTAARYSAASLPKSCRSGPVIMRTAASRIVRRQGAHVGPLSCRTCSQPASPHRFVLSVRAQIAAVGESTGPAYTHQSGRPHTGQGRRFVRRCQEKDDLGMVATSPDRLAAASDPSDIGRPDVAGRAFADPNRGARCRRVPSPIRFDH